MNLLQLWACLKVLRQDFAGQEYSSGHRLSVEQDVTPAAMNRGRDIDKASHWTFLYPITTILPWHTWSVLSICLVFPILINKNWMYTSFHDIDTFNYLLLWTPTATLKEIRPRSSHRPKRWLKVLKWTKNGKSDGYLHCIPGLRNPPSTE